MGRRPHTTLSGHLPSSPAPAHTPSRVSYFGTRKVRAALGDSAAGPVPGKPRVCSPLVSRASSQGTARTEDGIDHHLHQVHRRVSAFRGARKVSAFPRHRTSPFQQREGRVAPDPFTSGVGEGVEETRGEGGGPLVCRSGKGALSKERGQGRERTPYPDCGPLLQSLAHLFPLPTLLQGET